MNEENKDQLTPDQEPNTSSETTHAENTHVENASEAVTPLDTGNDLQSLEHVLPLPEDAPRDRERPRNRDKRKFQKPKREFTRYITVLFSGQREPADDMYICDIEKKGEWLTVTNLEQVRTRREVLEYLSEVESGLVGLDFSFSFPQPFVDFVKPEIKADDWRSMIKVIREDLKKNLDDGVRKWIERIGRYRESQLAPEDEERRFQRPDPRRRSNRGIEPLSPYERRSMAERFRRTEHNIRRPAEGHVTSALQIGYNRLTSRYEYGDARQRGRAALLGMSLLDQWIEANDKVKVWPWSQPDGGLVAVEVQPWLFTRGKTVEPAEFRKFLTIEEDNALEIEPHFKDLASRNPMAQQALTTTLGLIKAESRVERAIRPLRDYPKEFYSDPRVLAEGWYYGVGYKAEGAEPNERGGKGDRRDKQAKGPRKETPRIENESAAVDSSLANDLDKVSSVPQPPEHVQPEEIVEATAQDMKDQTPGPTS